MTARWIVGVDGSIASRSALGWALVHAPAHRADLVALHAYRHGGSRSTTPLTTDESDLTGPAASATHELEVAVSDLVGECDVERQIVSGNASRVLIEHAADADLLVVGHHGVGGRWHHTLGSVSRYCVTHATVPVVVVPGGWAGSEARRVLVGFDGSDRSRRALRWALDFAGRDTGRISVSALAAIELTPWLDADQAARLLTDQLQAEERRLVGLLHEVDPDKLAERHVLIGSARDMLAREAESSDLVVLGAKGAGRPFGVHLGSVTTWMLDNTSRPLVVVPAAG